MQRSTLTPPRNHLWQRFLVHSLFWVVWVTPGVGVASALGSVLLSGHTCRCSGIVLVFLHQPGAKKAQGIQLSLPRFPKNLSPLHSAAKHLLSPARYVAPGPEIPSCVPHSQARKPGGWGQDEEGHQEKGQHRTLPPSVLGTGCSGSQSLSASGSSPGWFPSPQALLAGLRPREGAGAAGAFLCRLVPGEPLGGRATRT